MSSEMDKVIAEVTAPSAAPKRFDPLPKPRPRKVVKAEAVAILETEIEKAAKKPTIRHDSREAALELFEEAAGGREELKRVLEHCPKESTVIGYIRKLLDDKDFLVPSHYTLEALCARHRIPLNVVITAFRDAKMAQMTIESLMSLAGGVPKVIEQLASDSTNRYDECPVCEGSKRIWRVDDRGEWLMEEGLHVTQLCMQCRGTGKVFKEHDFQNRKTMLEITGILPKGNGTTQNMNVDNRKVIISGDFQPGDGSFERLVQAIDRVTVKPVEEVIDIEIPYSNYEETPNPVEATPPVRE